MGIVGDELPLPQHPLHHGVAAVLDPDLVALVHLGADVAVAGGRFGQGAVDVHLRHRPGRAEDAVGGRRHLSTHLLEQLPLQLHLSLPGVQDAVLQLPQLRRDEAFSPHQGLAPLVVRRHQVQVGPGDLDVVAEDLVVAQLQALDAGALPFPPLQIGQHLTGVLRQGAGLVQLRREAGPYDAPFVEAVGRVVRQGAPHQGHHIGAGAEPPQQLFVQGAGSGGEPLQVPVQGLPQRFHQLQSPGEGYQVPRSGHPGADAPHEPLQVRHLGQDLGDAAASHRRAVEELHAVLTTAYRLYVEQRLAQPAP
ncbi:hypothetical protein HRbin25_00840 [bacterium HR25]|nr:hypothetical protein HRbin25_00840 [bacterium HR25]